MLSGLCSIVLVLPGKLRVPGTCTLLLEILAIVGLYSNPTYIKTDRCNQFQKLPPTKTALISTADSMCFSLGLTRRSPTAAKVDVVILTTSRNID